ncbi:DUF6297 family protein [Georgenia sp. M64]|uniref:DUF6297 family protein n=1 Tax=Georgenia sp. M64 TaxID=3120520 RepID=UPI0030DF1054
MRDGSEALGVRPAPPTGRAVRRWSRRRSLERAESGLGDLLYDVYLGGFIVVLYTAMAFALAARLGRDLGGSLLDDASVAAARWLAVLVLAAGAAALVGLAARLGPISLPGHEATWWLPLPVDRRGLLRPAALRWPVVAALPGAVVAALGALVLVPSPGVATLAGAAVTGGAGAAALVLAVGLTQVSAGVHGRTRRAADTALAAVPLAGLAGLWWGWPAGVTHPPAAVVLGAAAAATVVLATTLAVALDLRLGRVSGSVVRERGASSAEALGSVLSLDTRGLGRALAAATEPAARRSARLRPVARVPRRWAPHAALVTSDAMLLLRRPRRLVQLVVAGSLPALALGPDVPVLTLALLVVGGYAAGLAVTDGAREASAAPALDTLLPLGQRTVRRLRLVVPTVVLVVWSAVVHALLAAAHADAGWLVVLAAPVWSAAAVRAAYRPLPDFSGPLVHTPFGVVPPGLGAAFLVGPDVVALGTLPLLVAVVGGSVTPGLFVAQGVLAVVAQVLAARSRPVPRSRPA